MIIAQVLFLVKPDRVDDFVRLTLDNVTHSRQEAGVVRFEFFRPRDAEASFMLFEQYRSAEDQAQHREAEHYKRWKAGIAELLDRPYTVTLLDKLA